MDAVTVRLAVDGGALDENTDYGPARLLDVSSARLYVGGVGVSALAAAVDAGLTSLLGPGGVTAGSLRGACMRDFKVDLTFTSLFTYSSTSLCVCSSGLRLGTKSCSPMSMHAASLILPRRAAFTLLPSYLNNLLINPMFFF